MSEKPAKLLNLSNANKWNVITLNVSDMSVNSMNLNVIEPDKHVLICGMTGTGKSYLCEHYLRGYQYVVKLDTKDETGERKRAGKSAWAGLREGIDFTIVTRFEELDDIETDKIIAKSITKHSAKSVSPLLKYLPRFVPKAIIKLNAKIISIGSFKASNSLLIKPRFFF